MLDPVTILTALAYAIAKNAGAEVFADFFGGEARSALKGDLKRLLDEFLTITKPNSNQELERAAARSSLHANLFCLMEALGESMEPARGKVAKWRQRIKERLPESLRDFRRPSEGFLRDADRAIRAASRVHGFWGALP